VIRTINAHILQKNKTALHLRATRTFTDCLGKERKAGEEWIVTFEDHEVHIPDVFEEVVGEVASITLTSRQYCYIIDPVEDGKNQLGQRKLVKGETHFFLLPGESLSPEGVCPVHILAPEEALIVRSREGFEETLKKRKTQRRPGDRWFIYGPGEYFPPTQVQVLQKRAALVQIEPLGVYMFYSVFSLVLFVMMVIACGVFFAYMPTYKIANLFTLMERKEEFLK